MIRKLFDKLKDRIKIGSRTDRKLDGKKRTRTFILFKIFRWR